jgi:ParB-like chromosome segregation protein Spo0J
MAHQNTKRRERVVDLGGGRAIWRAHIDSLREQDVNARVMPAAKFERLVENVRKEKGLESLPLCRLHVGEGGTEELQIISGHHRARAARAAGLSEIHVLVLEREMSRDEVVAKQLAHNALAGEDDPQVLAALYAEIQSIDAKLESGVFESDLEFDLKSVTVDEIALTAGHELVVLMFLPRQYERFEDALAQLDSGARVHLADYADFERYKEAAQKVAERDNVRNSAAIMSRMIDIVLASFEESPAPKPRRRSRAKVPA